MSEEHDEHPLSITMAKLSHSAPSYCSPSPDVDVGYVGILLSVIECEVRAVRMIAIIKCSKNNAVTFSTRHTASCVAQPARPPARLQASPSSFQSPQDGSLAVLQRPKQQ